MSTFNWLILLVEIIIQCTSELFSWWTYQIKKRMNWHVIHILRYMGAKMYLCHCHRYKDCNAVNYLPQILKCQLLAVTSKDKNLIVNSTYMSGYMHIWQNVIFYQFNEHYGKDILRIQKQFFIYLYAFEFSMTSIFTKLVHNPVQGPVEVRLQVKDYLALLKNHCRSSAGCITLWSGCCLFDTFLISILNFIVQSKYFDLN